jgi:hypothetical protein
MRDFFQELDRLWQPNEPGKIRLLIIGVGALLLQTNYIRGVDETEFELPNNAY